MPLPDAEIQRGGKFEIPSLHMQSLQLLIIMNQMASAKGEILFWQVGKAKTRATAVVTELVLEDGTQRAAEVKEREHLL